MVSLFRDQFENVLIIFLLVVSVVTIIFSVALYGNYVPSYFNSIYILLGSLLVTIIALILNRRSDKQKEDRKIQRITYLVTYTINLNLHIIMRLLDNLISDEYSKTIFDPLKTNFLDTVTSSVVNIDLEVELLQKIIIIEQLTLKINEIIDDRNKHIEHLQRSVPSHRTVSEVYSEQYLTELRSINELLKGSLQELSEKSIEIIDNFSS